MTAIALMMSAVLTLLALLHAAWALGSTWPAADEETLAKTVVGRRGILTMPPPEASSTVAVLLLAISVWPLWRTAQVSIPIPEAAGLVAGWGLAFGFAARGTLGYVGKWRRLMCEQPFATYDQRLYSPLCFLLAIGFALLARIGTGS